MKPAPDSDGASWPTLAALAAAVLGLHLLLLNGPTPGIAAAAHAAAPVRAPLEALQTRILLDPGGAPQPLATPARYRSVHAIGPSPDRPSASPAQTSQAPVVASPHKLRPAAPTSAEPDPLAPMDEFTVALAAGPVSTAPASDLPPVQIPQSAHLEYQVSGSARGIHFQAQGTLDWTRDAQRYNARMVLRMLWLGSSVQTSSGRIDATGLLPERFSDQRRSERTTHFDHAQQRIHFSSNAPEAALQAGVQDRLSVFLQLAGRLHARPQAYPAGQTIRLQVAGVGDAEIWHFQVGEEDRLELPAGPLRARHLMRAPRHAYDSRVEFWLAPSLSHLPVRLRVTQHNGDWVEQQLLRWPGAHQ